MAFVLAIFSLTLSFLAIFVYQWITPLPQLGIGFLYHISKVRLAIAGLSLAMALLAVVVRPAAAQFAVLAMVILLTPLSGFNHASRFLVSLDNPKHIPASTAGFSSDAELIAIEINGSAHAWPLEQLIPHHIANDWVGGSPVTAAW